MANYKLVDADQLDADLKTVADAIREKCGTDGELSFPDGMATAVGEIQSATVSGLCFAWDGTDTGVSFVGNSGSTFHKISDMVLTKEDLTGGYSLLMSSSVGISSARKLSLMSVSWETETTCWYGEASGNIIYCFPVAETNSLGTVPEAGIYAINYTIGDKTLMIFKP